MQFKASISFKFLDACFYTLLYVFFTMLFKSIKEKYL